MNKESDICYVCKTKINRCKYKYYKRFKHISVEWCRKKDRRLSKEKEPGEVLNGSICDNCTDKEVIIKNEKGDNN